MGIVFGYLTTHTHVHAGMHVRTCLPHSYMGSPSDQIAKVSPKFLL